MGGKKPLGKRELCITLLLLKGKLINVLNRKLKHNKRWLETDCKFDQCAYVCVWSVDFGL